MIVLFYQHILFLFSNFSAYARHHHPRHHNFKIDDEVRRSEELEDLEDFIADYAMKHHQKHTHKLRDEEFDVEEEEEEEEEDERDNHRNNADENMEIQGNEIEKPEDGEEGPDGLMKPEVDGTEKPKTMPSKQPTTTIKTTTTTTTEAPTTTETTTTVVPKSKAPVTEPKPSTTTKAPIEIHPVQSKKRNNCFDKFS